MPTYRILGQADGLQKQWKVHSTVRHAIARFQHSKWSYEGRVTADSDSAYLLVWRQTPKQLKEKSAAKK
eukprot:2875077-Amphidinium_carterae.1